MQRGMTGDYVTSSVGGEVVKAFVPHPLPAYQDLVISGALRDKIDKAMLDLGRLDSAGMMLPETPLFLYSYIRKEAVLSSQIEGTQSSISDLLVYEADGKPGVPLDDVEEVSCYVAALEFGLKRVREGFPVSLRLFREIHEVLLSKGRGSQKDPGQFRRSQNWIGGTRPGNARFVPPPPERVMECLDVLEKYLHDQPNKTPALVKAALAHVQFETIHPFLDGNGRLGRLIITLLLCTEGVLNEPLLYLSLYFKENRQTYYDLLTEIRETGDWEKWIDFFIEGVRETAAGAVKTARDLAGLVRADREKIQTIGRSAPTVLSLHHALGEHPILSMKKAEIFTRLTLPTVVSAFNTLERLGMVEEVSGRRRGRIYAYKEYLRVLHAEAPKQE